MDNGVGFRGARAFTAALKENTTLMALHIWDETTGTDNESLLSRYTKMNYSVENEKYLKEKNSTVAKTALSNRKS